MARTSGHGNPNWGKDEVILALELYLECNGKIPSSDDPRVKRLSDTLRTLPYHAEASRRPTFRNADGVSFKLQNIRQVATGRGLGNVGAMDREVWAELGAHPQRVKEIAEAIRAAIVLVAEDLDHDDEEEFPEGKTLSSVHLTRERNRSLRKKLIAQRRKNGPLTCDLCQSGALPVAAEFDAASFEAHHLVGLAKGVERHTRLSDMALVHANCHRLIHAAIIKTRAWLTLEQVRGVVGLSTHTVAQRTQLSGIQSDEVTV